MGPGSVGGGASGFRGGLYNYYLHHAANANDPLMVATVLIFRIAAVAAVVAGMFVSRTLTTVLGIVGYLYDRVFPAD
ncbi:hypothetical protein MN608_01155 [Microdochium nivale]|nr:hypothetical protein MN608_01155 [Microdochium nivale]